VWFQVHQTAHVATLPPAARTFVTSEALCCNWVRSASPVDTPLQPQSLGSPVNVAIGGGGGGDVHAVSAGTRKHELTTAKSMESILRFFANVHV